MRRAIATMVRKMGGIGAVALAAGCGSSGGSTSGSNVGGGGAASGRGGGTQNAGGDGSAGTAVPAGGAGGSATGPLSCDANFTIRNVAFYADAGMKSPELTSCPSMTPPVAAITGDNVTTSDTGVIVYGTAPYTWAAYSAEGTGQLPVALSVDSTGTLAVRASPYSADGSYAYAAAGFAFISGSCLNASQYTGVHFEMAGDFGNCKVLFQVGDAEDSQASLSPGRGECQTGQCIGPYFEITKPGTYDVAFSMAMNGAPVSSADATAILGVQWLLSVGQ